jgi:rhodanese-related sulfurtransferase
MIKDVEQEILLVADEDRIEEAVIRLSRVGFDKTLGFLKGGVEAWKAGGKELDTVDSIDAEEFAKRFKDGKLNVFDVRKDGEFKSEHVENAENTPLDYLNDHLAEFPKDETFYLHCAGGYRSLIAGSILKSRGYHNLVNVEGGFKAIQETDIPVTDYVCPSTLK